MSTIDWANPVSGTFTTAADWSGGVVPGAHDTAIINAYGADPYTVTVDTPVKLAGLTIDYKHATVLDTGSLTVRDFDLATGRLILDRGTLAGTLHASGGKLEIEGQGPSIFKSMTFVGNTTIYDKSQNVQSTVRISNGLTLTGAEGTGPGSAFFYTNVELSNTPILDNAFIHFLGGSATTYGLSFDGPTLTFGTGLNVIVSHLFVGSGQTLTNNGTISYAGINDLTQSQTGTVINNGLIAGQVSENAASFTNNGTIDEQDSEVRLAAAGLQHAGAAGIIDLSQGGQVDLIGNLTTAQLLSDLATQNIHGSGTFGFGIVGTLDNSGATLDVGGKSAYGSLGEGIYDGGTIVDQGSGDLHAANDQSQTFENLTYETSTSTISLFASLIDATVTGASTITFVQSGSGNAEITGGTLAGVGTVLAAGLTLNGADITGVGNNGKVQIDIANVLEVTRAQVVSGYNFSDTGLYGTFTLDSGALLDNASLDVSAKGSLNLDVGYGATQGVTLGAHFTTTVSAGGSIMTGSHDPNPPSIINAGTINCAGTIVIEDGFTNQGVLNISGLVAGTFDDTAIVNSGLISITSGGTLDVSTSPSFTNNGTIAVNGGEFDVTLAALVNSGSIVVTNGTLGLAGNSTVASLTAIATPGSVVAIDAGTLSLGGGTITSGSGGVPTLGVGLGGEIADGTLQIDHGQVLTDYGDISAALINDGTVDFNAINGDEFVFNAAITGSGTISLGKGYNVFLKLGTAVASQVIKFGSNTQQLVFGAAQDATGFGGTLSGFQLGDSLMLYGENVASAAFVGKSIVATLSGGGTIDFATSTALSGTLEVFNGDELVYYSAASQASANLSAAEGDRSASRTMYWGHGGSLIHDFLATHSR